MTFGRCMDGYADAKMAPYAKMQIAVWGTAHQGVVLLNLGKPLVILNRACAYAYGSEQYTSWWGERTLRNT